jgi:hypothetical protein
VSLGAGVFAVQKFILLKVKRWKIAGFNLEQNYDVYQDSYCNDVTVEDALLEKKN